MSISFSSAVMLIIFQIFSNVSSQCMRLLLSKDIMLSISCRALRYLKFFFGKSHSNDKYRSHNMLFAIYLIEQQLYHCSNNELYIVCGL